MNNEQKKKLTMLLAEVCELLEGELGRLYDGMCVDFGKASDRAVDNSENLAGRTVKCINISIDNTVDNAQGVTLNLNISI